MAMRGLGDLAAAHDPNAQADADDGDQHQAEGQARPAPDMGALLKPEFLALLGIKADAAGALAQPGKRTGEQIIIGVARLRRPAELIALSAWPAEIGVGH